VEQGWLTQNRVPLSPELVAAFRENWALLVDTPHQADVTLPFYHLQRDGFWRVETHNRQPLPGHIRSLATLHQLGAYGTLDESLYELLREATTYFPQTKAVYAQQRPQGAYLHTIEQQVLHEPTIGYVTTQPLMDEAEVFVRGSLFKRLVPKVYNYTCCFSGMRVISTYEVSLVDACHIVPFSVSGDDTIGNGLALCPNLHRAFDRGLLSVDADYRVLVSEAFGEAEGHPYSLRALLGKLMALPFDRKLYPSAENLTWHREQVFRR
jgi:putative restriction endonuclease